MSFLNLDTLIAHPTGSCESTFRWYGTLSTKEKINIKIDNLPPFKMPPIDIKVEEQRHSRVPYLQPRQNSLMILWLGGVTRLKREFNIVRPKENPLSNHPHANQKLQRKQNIPLHPHRTVEEKATTQNPFGMKSTSNLV